MKASELIDQVAIAACVDASTAKKAVEAVFAGIVEAAKKGEEVSLPSFGKLLVAGFQPRRAGWNLTGPSKIRSCNVDAAAQ